MKRFFALTLALIMVLCVCGCSSDNNTSSEPSEVEYETIIVDQNGQEITSSTDTSTSEGTTDNSSMDTPTQSSVSSNASGNSAIVIDYDTVVEVDICDDIIRGYLEAKDAKNQYFWLSTYSGQKYDHQVLSLDWYRDGSLSYTIYFSENADFSNSTTITTKYSNVEGTTLIPGKTYYWKVIGTLTADALGGGRIKVKDVPVRWINIDGVGNVRDMGGWKTTSGKTVKYGMLYRGRKLENVTEEGIATIKQLGLKTELDIRYASQKFQTPGTGMNYEFIESPGQYDGVMKNEPEVFKASYKRLFEVLSDESNYPFYAHCNAGADRTGTYAFIVNGLLGVSYEDLTRDFELTSFSSSGKRWRGKGTGGTFAEGDDVMQEDSNNTVAWGRLYKTMMAYGAENGCTTLQSSIEHWLLNYIGVPQSHIDSFKSIMLE
ncbi:MAG: tyrosine-protein phosphatase [Clostridia bacterium]|nr:tyrosine-protein phosphatase [Clostridia bacterium]